MGRRTKLLNKDIYNTIIKYISNGNYIKTACLAAGIDGQTYYNWLHRAEAYDGSNGDSIYFDFFELLKRAEAENIARNVKNIQDAGDNDKRNWMASAWLMERKYPAEYGKRIELDIGPSKVLIALQEQAHQLTSKETKVIELTGDE